MECNIDRDIVLCAEMFRGSIASYLHLPRFLDIGIGQEAESV